MSSATAPWQGRILLQSHWSGARIDHWAAVVDVGLESFVQQQVIRHRRAIDPEALRNPANRAEILQILAAAPSSPWQCNVHEHVACTVAYLQGELSARFPRPCRNRRGFFMSESTQVLHRSLVAARAAVRGRSHALRCTRLRCAFLAWAGLKLEASLSLSFEDLYDGAWLRALRVHIAVDLHRIEQFGSLVRSACRRDKAEYVTRLALELREAPASEVHAALHRLIRPRKFAKQAMTPLPRLRLESGAFCSDPQQVQDRWRRYFSRIEAGFVQDPDALAVQCLQTQQERGPLLRWPGDQLPTLAGLEAAFRQVSCRKAAGPDGIPPDLCSRFSPQLAELFWPVLLKTLFFTAEAAGFKGVTLHHIPKGRGDLADCTASRAIVVQSCISKAMQRALRPILMRRLEQSAPELLLGGRQGQSALFGSFAVRSFLRSARAGSRSAAVIFFDIASAYYAVIHELLVGWAGKEPSVSQLAAGLNLTAEEMQAVAHNISAEPVLQHEGSDMIQRLVSEVGQATWFVMVIPSLCRRAEVRGRVVRLRIRFLAYSSSKPWINATWGRTGQWSPVCLGTAGASWCLLRLDLRFHACH